MHIALLIVLYILGWFICASIWAVIDDDPTEDVYVYFSIGLIWPMIAVFGVIYLAGVAFNKIIFQKSVAFLRGVRDGFNKRAE